jgi:hypothetical protein
MPLSNEQRQALADIQQAAWEINQAVAVILLAEQAPPPPTMKLWSQRDARWRDTVYASGATFGRNGCYVICVAMIASLAGYTDEPPEVARKLREANCFVGGDLRYLARVPTAYPKLACDGLVNWHGGDADLVRLRAELERGPVILEVDFHPGGVKPPGDAHFVVAESFTADGLDLNIADPWDGSRVKLLARYALKSWDLGDAVWGMRLLRPT